MYKNAVLFFLLNSIISLSINASDDNYLTSGQIFSYALTPIVVADQITLKSNDLISEKSSINSSNVFYADLSDTDFSKGNKDGNNIIEFFRTSPFPNLRCLILDSTKNVKEFLKRVFDSDERNFFSLVQIRMNNTDVDDSDIDLIVNHFARYDKIVRDIPQFSARDDSVAFELKLDVKNSPSVTKKGLLNPNPFISVYYRAGAQIKMARFQPEIQ